MLDPTKTAVLPAQMVCWVQTVDWANATDLQLGERVLLSAQ
jgi:hypothetical protein